MAFALSSGSVPTIRSYEAALAEWEKRPEYPARTAHNNGMRWNEKPLSPYKHKTHLVIRKDGNGDVALRYHDTDVTTYHANGDITIEGYQSQSTEVFLERTTPGFRFRLTDDTLGFVVMTANEYTDYPQFWSECRAHRFYSSIRLTRAPGGDWTPVGNDAMFEVPVTDRELARKELKAFRFGEFRDWYYARIALGGSIDTERWDEDPEEVCDMLSDISRWETLTTCAFTDWRPERGWGGKKRDDSPKMMRKLFIEGVRQRILFATGALQLRKEPTLGYGALEKLRKEIRQYAWLFH